MRQKTSWQAVHAWYDEHQKEQGGYYHREVIFPKVLPLLHLKPTSRILDLGCGEGILGRKIMETTSYTGVDASSSLIKRAREKDLAKAHHYLVGDVTKTLDLPKNFTHALFVLSLQNISNPKKALLNASKHLEEGGSLTLVLNHPCFRIPKYSSWGRSPKSQYRRLDRYLSSFKVSLQAHPSKQERSEETLSFHNPLSVYFKILKECSFYIEDFLELSSNKKSYGKQAQIENFSRNEFPLFAVLCARKKESP